MMEIYTKHEVPNEITIDKAIAFWKQELKGKKFYNASIDRYIYVTKDGIEKCIWGNKGKIAKIRLQLIYLIKYLIQDAIKVKEEKDKKGRKDIITVFTLKTSTMINKDKYNVYITIKETTQNVLYYYHAAVLIKKERATLRT